MSEASIVVENNEVACSMMKQQNSKSQMGRFSPTLPPIDSESPTQPPPTAGATWDTETGAYMRWYLLWQKQIQKQKLLFGARISIQPFLTN